ncbi:MAG: NADH-quinone oxidoreductase subunit N [Chloroflexota bacterium]|nr:NADH-quinone oxidoreductase subunit N [Chloroflexota bacterium]
MASIDRLGPELILLIFAGIIILADLVVPRWRSGLVAASLLGVAGSIVWSVTLVARDMRGGAFDGALVVDDFSLFFSFLFAGIAALVILASIEYVDRFVRHQAEYYALILASTAGMMLLAATTDLIAIFIALELTGVCLYILVAFLKDVRSSEAGLKYLLLGALSTAVTLYGMAFLFGLSGSTNLTDIANVVAQANDDTRAALVMAMVLLAAGLGFKMAVVPFQMWVPDVYEGAPTPITAYLSVGSKAAGFAVVMRIFMEALDARFISGDWANMFAGIAAVSMTVGNLIALTQTNIKRMLGYSSIAQAGNFLVGLAAISAADGELALGASGVLFFLAAYAFTNLGAFIAIIAISNRTGSDEIGDYAGMSRRAPLLALGLTLCLVSLTGIPPTAGFIAKVYIFNAAVQSDLVWLVIVGVLNSVVSVYYYLRVVLQMYLEAPVSEERIAAGPALGLAMAIASAGVLFIGILPFPLLEAAEAAAQVFG